jgi:uncharacterized protein (UPF0212 family)
MPKYIVNFCDYQVEVEAKDDDEAELLARRRRGDDWKGAHEDVSVMRSDVTFKCPKCGEDIDRVVEVGTYWTNITVLGDDPMERDKREVEFIYCPECNADITKEWNEWVGNYYQQKTAD